MNGTTCEKKVAQATTESQRAGALPLLVAERAASERPNNISGSPVTKFRNPSANCEL
jgi:hypothetical protein